MSLKSSALEFFDRINRQKFKEPQLPKYQKKKIQKHNFRQDIGELSRSLLLCATATHSTPLEVDHALFAAAAPSAR